MERAFRTQQAVAFSRIALPVALAMTVVAFARPLVAVLRGQQQLDRATKESLHSATLMGLLLLPALASRLGAPPWVIDVALVVSHVSRSFTLLWGADVRSVKLVVRSHMELAMEICLIWQDLMGLPTMAILHALRLSCYMYLVTKIQLGTSPARVIIRGLFDWCVLMLASRYLDTRWRQQWAKHVESQQAAALSMRQGLGSEKPGPSKACLPAQACSPAVPTAKGAKTVADTKGKLVPSPDAQPASKPPVRDSAETLRGAEVSPVKTSQTDTGRAAHGAVRRFLDWSRELGARVRGEQCDGGAPRVLTPVQCDAACSAGEIMVRRPTRVYVKLHGMEPESLPHDVRGRLDAVMQRRMGEVALAVVTTRRGCVILTLDLESLVPAGSESPTDLADLQFSEDMREVISHLVRDTAVAKLLSRGSAATIQVADRLLMCEWSEADRSYQTVGNRQVSPTPATGYHLKVQPSVLCVNTDLWASSNLDVAWPHDDQVIINTLESEQPAVQRVSLTVRAVLPPGCRLSGWQPEEDLLDLPAAAGRPQLHSGAAADDSGARLLVRSAEGGYLANNVSDVCVDIAATMTNTHSHCHVTAKVTVELKEHVPAALCCELWFLGHAASIATGAPALTLTHSSMTTDAHPSISSATGAPASTDTDSSLASETSASGSESAARASSCRSQASMDRALHDSLSCEPGQSRGLHVGQGVAATEPRREVIVSDCTLLLLSTRWEEAAAELQQHVDSLLQLRSSRSSRRSADRASQDAAAGDSQAGKRLLEDLGTWLDYTSHSHNHGRIQRMCSSLLETLYTQLGDDLLLYAVGHGLVAVAEMIVSTLLDAGVDGGLGRLCKTSDSVKSVPMQPPPSTPPAWLLRAACCLSATGTAVGVVYSTDGSGAAAAQPGRKEATSILHEAMACGKPEMLRQVLRWGLYGGYDWRWPWELQDAFGNSALHYTATLPPCTCAAMLDVLSDELSLPQLQAARSAWRHCKDSQGTSPVALAKTEGGLSKLGHQWQDPVASAAGSMVRSGAVPVTAAAAGGAVAAQRPVARDKARAGGLRQCVREAWTLHTQPEYNQWLDSQWRKWIAIWAATIIAVVAVCSLRAHQNNVLALEWPVLMLHGFFYVFVFVSAAGVRGLGTWQSWLLASHVGHALAMWVASINPIKGSTWDVANLKYVDFCFSILLMAPWDQTPLPTLALALSLQAYCAALMFNTGVHTTRPFLRSTALHVVYATVTLLCRMRQVKAYRAWRHAKERSAHGITSGAVKDGKERGGMSSVD